LVHKVNKTIDNIFKVPLCKNEKVQTPDRINDGMSGDETEDIIDILEKGKKDYQYKHNVMKNIMAANTSAGRVPKHKDKANVEAKPVDKHNKNMYIDKIKDFNKRIDNRDRSNSEPNISVKTGYEKQILKDLDIDEFEHKWSDASKGKNKMEGEMTETPRIDI
jgi:hypothetical protein